MSNEIKTMVFMGMEDFEQKNENENKMVRVLSIPKLDL